MWALVRMNPNEPRKGTRKRNAGSLPASTMCSSKRLPMLARAISRRYRKPRSRRQHDLADVPALVDEAVGVGGALEREGLGDDRLDAARRRGPRRAARSPASRLPSRSHQLSMLSPKTPLFSFMIAMLFHHGIVAVVIAGEALEQRRGCCAPRRSGPR